MLYLMLLVILAGTGILKLWLHQRRERRAVWREVEGFWAGLERIAHTPPRRTMPAVARRRPAPRNMPAARAPSRDSRLDARRRAEAQRRIQSRRRAQARRSRNLRARAS